MYKQNSKWVHRVCEQSISAHSPVDKGSVRSYTRDGPLGPSIGIYILHTLHDDPSHITFLKAIQIISEHLTAMSCTKT